MSLVTVTIPPKVEKQVRALASAQGLSLERYISATLEQQARVSELLAAVEAQRGKVSGKRFLELLDKAPDVAPMKGDEIPPDLAARLQARRKKRSIR